MKTSYVCVSQADQFKPMNELLLSCICSYFGDTLYIVLTSLILLLSITLVYLITYLGDVTTHIGKNEDIPIKNYLANGFILKTQKKTFPIH